MHAEIHLLLHAPAFRRASVTWLLQCNIMPTRTCLSSSMQPCRKICAYMLKHYYMARTASLHFAMLAQMSLQALASARARTCPGWHCGVLSRAWTSFVLLIESASAKKILDKLAALKCPAIGACPSPDCQHLRPEITTSCACGCSRFQKICYGFPRRDFSRFAAISLFSSKMQIL